MICVRNSGFIDSVCFTPVANGYQNHSITFETEIIQFNNNLINVYLVLKSGLGL